MNITPRQRIAMAVIVLVGLIGVGAVLLPDRGRSDRDAAGHARAGHDEKGRETGRDTEHADEHEKEGGKDHAQDHETDHAQDRERDHAQDHERDHEKNHAKDGDKDSDKDGDKTGGKARQADAATATRPHQERAVRLGEDRLKASGITTQIAGAATLRAVTRFQGEIRFNDDRTAHVVPRLAGVAEAVRVNLGQTVRQGEVLAVIASSALSDQRSELLTARLRREAAQATYEREKTLWQAKISAEQDYLQAQGALREADIAVRNATQKLAAVGAEATSHGLNRFEIRAPFAGTIVEKHLSLGEAVAENASIFTVSDLGSVWAEFAVAPKDLGAVRVGQKVVISSTAFDEEAEGSIAYVGALLGEQTRTARLRVTLANPRGAWRPGLFVTVAVRGEELNVPLAVNADAVQTVDGQPMLFVAEPGGFVARPVQLGRGDGKNVEVKAGLAPGDRYAATNTFILKSELGKAGAEHGH